MDAVEPPKFITSRHVTAMFEKLGFDPSGGQRIFAALCEAVSRRRQDIIDDESGEDRGSDSGSASASGSAGSKVPNAVLAAAAAGGEGVPPIKHPDEAPSTPRETGYRDSVNAKMDVKDFMR